MQVLLYTVNTFSDFCGLRPVRSTADRTSLYYLILLKTQAILHLHTSVSRPKYRFRCSSDLPKVPNGAKPVPLFPGQVPEHCPLRTLPIMGMDRWQNGVTIPVLSVLSIAALT